ncbi:putative porin [Rhodoblastus acidophilus]|nr:porin [Rhodoblastus acidophilus]MCW2274259.1 putative porin [Rhodoblastus acidophilus]
MKNHLMAAAAVLALMSASSVAYAGDQADVKALKAQAAELKKQNAALEQRLNKLETQQAADASASPTDFLAQVTKGPLPVVLDDGPICWKGICINGAIDGGLAWAQHGAPLNAKYYNGNGMLTSQANRPYFGFNPNGLGSSQIGIKGSVEILPGWSGVFTANTYFNPQSGQLQNAPGSLVDNQGLPVAARSLSADGSRGGQAFNDQLFVGVSSKDFGTLTFGRHRTFATDLVVAYDATGGASAYSLLGYSGSYVSGLGYTGDGRWDNSLKYKVSYGPARFGAMYKFIDGNGGSNWGNTTCLIGSTGCPVGTVNGTTVPRVFYARHNDAAQFDLGASYGGFDIDGVIGYYHQATTGAALSSLQLSGTSTFTPPLPGAALTTVGNNNSGTLSGTAQDATGGAIGAKYTWNQWKFYAGWAHLISHNPADPVGIGSQNDQGGYVYSSVNNRAFPRARLLDTEWFGVRYAWDPKTDIVAQYVHVGQNNYYTNTPAGAVAANCGGTNAVRASSCSGYINQFGAYVDYHFTKRFDVYGGVSYSNFAGGLAAGYFYNTNWTPSVGARFVF